MCAAEHLVVLYWGMRYPSAHVLDSVTHSSVKTATLYVVSSYSSCPEAVACLQGDDEAESVPQSLMKDLSKQVMPEEAVSSTCLSVRIDLAVCCSA